MASVVQVASNQVLSAGELTTTLPGPATAGNVLVAVMTNNFATNDAVIPTGFTEDARPNAAGGCNLTMASMEAVGGETSVTYTIPSRTNARMVLTVLELEGVERPASSPSGVETVVTSNTTHTVGPINAEALMVAGVSLDSYDLLDPAFGDWSDGFTTQAKDQTEGGSNNVGQAVGTKVVTPAAATSSTITWSSGATVDSAGALVAFPIVAQQGPNSGSASGTLLLSGTATGEAPGVVTPSFRSLTSDIALSGDTDLVLAAPAGLTVDDPQLVVITHSSGDDPIVSADPGWTRILQYDNPHAAGANGENERIEVWTAKGPTGTATFGKTNTITSMHGIRVAYADGGSFTGADVLPQNDTLSRDDVHPVPEQTTSEANTLLISIVGAEERGLPVVTDWTAPSGWTERYNVTGDEGGDHIHLNLADLLVASPTTVSGATWTSTETSWSSNVSLLLEPTTATVPNSGSASGGLELSGSATGAASHEGSISGALVLDGAATGSADHSGSAAGGLVLDGSTTGHTDHAGSTSGALVLNGGATGEARHEGDISGGLVLSGSATGEAPSVGGASGSASGTLLLDGSATGATAHEGHATGALALSGDDTGSTVHHGAADGSLALSGDATGSTRHAGSVSGGLLLSGSALGNAPGGVVRDLGIIATEPPAVALATEAPTTALTAAEPTEALDALTPGSLLTTEEPDSLTPWEIGEAALTATTTEPTDEWVTLEPAL